MRSEQLKSHIAQIDGQLRPLLAEKSKLEAELRDALSAEWISANRVMLDDVADPDEKGLPWFGDTGAFIKHLRNSNSGKRWAAWNGSIYSTSELLAGRMECNAPGQMEHLRSKQNG